MLTDYEWNLLPKEEQERRIQLFTLALRGILENYDIETVKLVLQSSIKNLTEAEPVSNQARFYQPDPRD